MCIHDPAVQLACELDQLHTRSCCCDYLLFGDQTRHSLLSTVMFAAATMVQQAYGAEMTVELEAHLFKLQPVVCPSSLCFS